MQCDKLGDALDFWKGSILTMLKPSLEAPFVVPLITGAEPWTGEDISLYRAYQHPASWMTFLPLRLTGAVLTFPLPSTHRAARRPRRSVISASGGIGTG